MSSANRIEAAIITFTVEDELLRRVVVDAVVKAIGRDVVEPAQVEAGVVLDGHGEGRLADGDARLCFFDGRAKDLGVGARALCARGERPHLAGDPGAAARAAFGLVVEGGH